MTASRRQFLQASAAGLGMAAAASAADDPRDTYSANDKIQVALIGAGGMGRGDLSSFLAQDGTAAVAVCDVYKGRLESAKTRFGKDLFATMDYREVLARDDVDAVIIGTPDHWHSKIAVDAMDAGKDVYVEKPMIQKLGQGLEVIEAEQRNNRILQVGSQRVSSIAYDKARLLYEDGAIGKLTMVEAYWDRNSAMGAWQYTLPLDATPNNIDWKQFIGPADDHAFDPIRLFRWRNYQDYGTGVAGDLFVHLFSGIHYVTGSNGPNRILSTGGLRWWKDGRDVPDVMIGLYDYPETKSHPAFNLTLRVNFIAGGGGGSQFRFVGSEGEMKIAGQSVILKRVPRQEEPGLSIGTYTDSMQDKIREEYRKKYPETEPTSASLDGNREEVFATPRGYSDHRDHHRNFVSAIRSRKPVVEDATFGYRAAAPAVASNVSYPENRIVHWDPETMKAKS
jgi:predicted dehydrogenase